MDKNNTITLGDLRKILTDVRLSDDMPVSIYSGLEEANRGVQALEVHTLKDGTKVVAFFQHGIVYAMSEIDTAHEVFGSI